MQREGGIPPPVVDPWSHSVEYFIYYNFLLYEQLDLNQCLEIGNLLVYHLTYIRNIIHPRRALRAGELIKLKGWIYLPTLKFMFLNNILLITIY